MSVVFLIVDLLEFLAFQSENDDIIPIIGFIYIVYLPTISYTLQ
jgi:hypothetical protein